MGNKYTIWGMFHSILYTLSLIISLYALEKTVAEMIEIQTTEVLDEIAFFQLSIRVFSSSHPN